MTLIGPHLSLPQIAQLLVSGEVALEDYVEFCLSNIDDHDAQVMALLPEPNRRERLMAEVAALKKKFPTPNSRPPLFGVLVGVKDLFCVDGFETRAGSALPSKLFEGPEAVVVAQLKKMGALVLGKTVTTEFAFMEPGPTRNPHHLMHTPGGSSSGSAAAIACDYCSLSLGTQTIGSITRPAAYCGVVGFKPSYEQISREGVVPFSESADHIGFFTHGVAGARFVASLLLKNFDQSSLPDDYPRKPVLGVPVGPYLSQSEPNGLAHFENTLAKLSLAGYEIRRVPMFADIAEINVRHRAMITAELAAAHQLWFSEYRKLYRTGTREAIESGALVPAASVQAAREGRLSLRSQIHTAMEHFGVDLWVSPSAPNIAPAGQASTGSPVMNLPWTHAGMPTVSVPSGYSVEGLPFGIQIAGEFERDALLLAWSESIEAAISAR